MTSHLVRHSQNAVQRFLQSVMVIDDQATYPGAVRQAVEELTEPPSQPATDEDDPDPLAEETVPTRPDSLDAGALVEAFAEMGLVCGIMRPEPISKLEDAEAVLPAAARADIVVLDWQMGDDGDHALRILGKLSKREGLRLAAIYTFKSELDEIAQTITKEIGGAREGFHIAKGHFHIEVYAKETALIPDGDPASDRIHTPEQLSKRLLDDFARLTRGIVPTAAVAVIGALRHDTPRVLSLLGADLDSGYLGHRILLADPEDSARQLLDLIGSELRTVVEDDRIVRDALSMDGIKAYVSDMPSAPVPPDLILLALEIGTARSGALDELRGHPEFEKVSPKFGSKKGRIQGHTNLFTMDDGDALVADLLFGRRLSLRSDTDSAPTLQLGTIVKTATGSDWYVCVQRDCDAVRIDSPREFPLVPGSRIEPGPGIDLLVHHQGADFALCLDLHLYALRKYVFEPDPATRERTPFMGPPAVRAGGW